MTSERIAATAYTHAVAVTPSDSTDLATPARALFVGGAGAIVLNTTGGETSVTIAAVPAGTTLPLSVKRVRATGTTATSIVALR
ncbi:MAG: spike base protein, RCAP_Rcc01079 family [Thermomicrobiales bacterium]